MTNRYWNTACVLYTIDINDRQKISLSELFVWFSKKISIYDVRSYFLSKIGKEIFQADIARMLLLWILHVTSNVLADTRNSDNL